MSAAAPELKEGDWLDVVDGDGIWNVAQVLRLPSDETVEVTYDCWGDEYNEELPRDSPRIAPFHTHTWAVKCWAKLDTWPWWPALLTVRAPGSAFGSQNLRLEERLLVDFLDNADFAARCRCWVKKSNIVPFQSDEETRKQLTKSKRRKKSKVETRAKNVTVSTALLAQCDAREDFPGFVEGTLPVQFEHDFTRPTEEVRKEMGEEIWLRGFADNRVNHAATHVYTPTFADKTKASDGNDTAVPKSVEETSMTSEIAPNEAQPEEESTPTSDAGKIDEVDAPQEAQRSKTAVAEPQKMKVVAQNAINLRKRARPDDEKEASDSVDTGRAGKNKSPCVETKKEKSTKSQAANSIAVGTGENETKDVSKSISPANVPHVATRKYGKTPKVLKTPRRSATNLRPYTPPYARVLLQVNPRNEHHTAQSINVRYRDFQTFRACHATYPKPRASKDQAKPDTVQHVKQTDVTVRRNSSSDTKSDDGPASPIKSLARLTKATLRADKKLHSVEHALEDKLTELAKKSAEAEELRNKCAALKSARSTSAMRISPKEAPPKDIPAKISIRVSRKDSRSKHKATGRSDSSAVPTLARRSSQSQCGIRGLELALDDKISMLQGLNSATTRAEFDAMKAELLNSSEVQAAIMRIEHPSYGWATPTGATSRWTPSVSNGNSLHMLEAVKSRYSEYLSATVSTERRPSPRSPSQHFDRSWGYERENRSSAERSSSPSNSPLADHSSFGFSVNDNFSMNQWYRDLYPKAFNFQQPR
ncbi:hypothetical protein PF005_g14940 [Phytophthora fragariae]|uniref:PWWP domain-containing protein n=1 Tax=Phytophthora fragariae TaxID=53985 RepID=A0A6A3YHF0_9STRA|nr:hypothetical protein PF003_g14548 [Phytophthora fragariae]KAE8933714.1 hypothetical protein PF009_g16285 [Phytophthora fragariae]KAE9084017.1 hypothetical protein PF010_g20999 [Phytophthora fragariae]KAE9100953.1 hypothetical protein PF007_g15327 [Phytophthora fragariae]KAE9109176.1 hypothetical protein PF006_g20724 [Phytophthora fragariae]